MNRDEESHSSDCRWIAKAALVLIGAVFVIGGLLLLGVCSMVGRIDTNSVTVLLSQNRMDQEMLSEFDYTPWQEPTTEIRPFHFWDKSFADCKIIRYRRGSSPYLLMWRTYYEAEYQRPDGTIVNGPAFGPLPYTAPNLHIFASVILTGVVILAVGIVLLKTSK